MKQRLFIILIPLLPLIVSAQYKLRAVEIATGDSIWQNVAQDSMFKKVAGNYVFAFKPRYKNYSPSFNGGTANQYIKKNSTLEYDYSWSTIAGGGDLLAANNLSDVANVATARQNIGLNTTANISPSANKNFVTDAQQIVIGSILGINTGDNATNTQYSGLSASKQNVITLGSTAQYFRGDLSLATFPTTTAAFTNSTNKNFVTDAQSTVIGNTSGTNTGDNSVNTLYSGLVSNATHSGDATGATVLTLATVNSNVGSFGSATQVPNYTVNGKGLITAASNTTIQIAESQVTNLVSDLAGKQPTITVLPFANGGISGSVATSATTGTMTVNMTSSIITITPTGACTFNASGGVAGQLVTFSITTSGVSSFVLTFGTNFRKTGTLATGTVSARFFTVTFRCLDGTIWSEISRTAVQT